VIAKQRRAIKHKSESRRVTKTAIRRVSKKGRHSEPVILKKNRQNERQGRLMRDKFDEPRRSFRAGTQMKSRNRENQQSGNPSIVCFRAFV
jgi:hypothetical protein